MLPLVYSNLGCPDWSFEKSADEAVANGYAGLEIRLLGGDSRLVGGIGERVGR